MLRSRCSGLTIWVKEYVWKSGRIAEEAKTTIGPTRAVRSAIIGRLTRKVKMLGLV
jgi:hypothetical protein